MYKKTHWQYLFIIVVLLFLQGCSFQNQYINTSDIDKVSSDMVATSDIDSYKEIYYSLGIKLKALSDMPNIDEPAIIVNSLTITRRDIEIAKIHGEFTKDFSLKEKIWGMIREKVEIADAIRLNIEPNYEELYDYLERTKNALNENLDDKEVIQAYMDAMQLTEEEYFNSLEEIEYINYQRMAWWETVKPKEIILSEAKKRNIDVNDIDYEYREKYVDELVKKAEIEILDSEIQKVLWD